jgi:rod shape-determining protein MreB and related proteins
MFKISSKSIGIDLGTSSVIVYVHKKGIQIQEPSVIVVGETKNNSNIMYFFGAKAKAMIGKTPGHLISQRPIRKGVIIDMEATLMMLCYLIRQVTSRSKIKGLKLVVGIPYNCTEVERNAVKETCKMAGATEVYLLDEPVAAAIGAGLPILESTASLIVDIGGGTTEIAVLSIGGIVVGESIPIAGDTMDEAIIRMFKVCHNLIIGENTAEGVKLTVGSVFPLDDELVMEVRGRDNDTGLPKTVSIGSEELRTVLLVPAMAIVDVVKSILGATPAELCADLISNGVFLAGGGSLVRGFDKLLSGKIGLPVSYADDPITCVARGTGEYLNILQRRESRKINQTVLDYVLGQ